MTDKKDKVEEFKIITAKEAAKFSESAMVDLQLAVEGGIKQSARIGLYVCQFQKANVATWSKLIPVLEEAGYEIEDYSGEVYIKWGESSYCLSYKLIGPSPVLEDYLELDEDV
jgi:hypothetical protein